ncbi:unnamed protein product [Moneuplotes crassus]|uniref:Uncharacterized protein n=1 Tax=Euplotes crassus TaxID=5936 RepID=A0AAD1Y1D7_EUPCR|nr:unnamed protein product [Moneuplotes crassus]
MNAEFYCCKCRIQIGSSTCLCVCLPSKTFIEKYQEQLSTNLVTWKEFFQIDLIIRNTHRLGFWQTYCRACLYQDFEEKS